eukprot:jgi/Picre1/33728/NNA_001207.t1
MTTSNANIPVEVPLPKVSRGGLYGYSSAQKELQEFTAGKKCYQVWRTEFVIDKRYQPIKAIGKGAYGVVCSAQDTVSQKKVAIKKITNAFENIIDAKRTLRELVLLRCLKHENIIGVERVEKTPVVMGKAYYPVESAVDRRTFPVLTYQILRGLKYVHSASVLHRDLKPSNVLLNASCDLKIADFGLARTETESNNFMTEYVKCCCVSQSFPEGLSGSAEAYYQDAWKSLDDELDFITAPKARAYIEALPKSPKPDFRRMFREDTVAEALEHPWLKALHDPATEPEYPQTHGGGPFKFDFEEDKMQEADVRQKVWEEMCHYS